MSNTKQASLHATFSVDGEVSNKDTRFLKVTIDVLNTGANDNGSYFSKEVVDENIDTIKNTPILGFIKYDAYTRENDFKGHEYVIKRTENGVEQIYQGSCYGVIPESCDPRWVTKTTDTGEELETLQVDGLMWEKFSDATGILKRDSEKSQSMELYTSSIEGYDGQVGDAAAQFDGDVPLRQVAVDFLLVTGEAAVDGGKPFQSRLVDALQSAYPQFEVGVDGVLHQHGDVHALQRIRYLLHGEGVGCRACTYPQDVDAGFQSLEHVLGRGYFGGYVHARLLLHFLEPG